MFTCVYSGLNFNISRTEAWALQARAAFPTPSPVKVTQKALSADKNVRLSIAIEVNYIPHVQMMIPEIAPQA
jgi:hypothetical protein